MSAPSRTASSSTATCAASASLQHNDSSRRSNNSRSSQPAEQQLSNRLEGRRCVLLIPVEGKCLQNKYKTYHSIKPSPVITAIWAPEARHCSSCPVLCRCCWVCSANVVAHDVHAQALGGVPGKQQRAELLQQRLVVASCEKQGKQLVQLMQAV